MTFFVEHHIVDLRVAMTNALGQHAFAVYSFCLAHFVGMFLQLVYHVLYLFHAPCGIGIDGILELQVTQLHVVEVGYGLADCVGHVDKQCLEIGERLACMVRILWSYGLIGNRIGDEDGYSPIVIGLVFPIRFAVFSRDKTQHFAFYIGLFALFQLVSDVVCHCLYVVLKQVYVAEHLIVDALKHIVRTTCFLRFDFEGIVDKSVTKCGNP